MLVDNACKYAGAGGTVEVGVSVSGGRVVLTVDDSGPGIPEGDRDLVFDRFHRADQAPGGTGLGLAIADAVVRSTVGHLVGDRLRPRRGPLRGHLAPGRPDARPALPTDPVHGASPRP